MGPYIKRSFVVVADPVLNCAVSAGGNNSVNQTAHFISTYLCSKWQMTWNWIFQNDLGTCGCVHVSRHVHAHTHAQSWPAQIIDQKAIQIPLSVATLSSDWQPANLWIWDTVVLYLEHSSTPKCLFIMCWSRIISSPLRSVRRKSTNRLNNKWEINI